MYSSSRHLTVKQVTSAVIHTCSPENSLIDAVALMRKHKVSAIFVRDGDEICGVWTESDSVRLDFSDDQFRTLRIADVMNSPVRSIADHKLLSEAAVAFHNYGLRHLLVTDERGEAYGVLSISDVVRNQGVDQYLHLRPVDKHYDAEVPVIDGRENMAKVAELMRHHPTRAVLVYDEREAMYGILTQRDILDMLLSAEPARECWHYASRPLLQVTEKTSLLHAYRLMSEQKVRHLVVTDDARETILGVLGLKHVIAEVESAYVSELEKVLKQRDNALRTSQRNLYLANKIIDASLDGVMITDSQGLILQVNPAFTRLTGYDAAEVIGQTPNLLSSGLHGAEFYQGMWKNLRHNGVWQGEICNRRKSGEIYVEWLTIMEIRENDGEELVYAAIFSDITERKNAEKKIARLAYFDELTELPNRRLFRDRLAMALATAHRDAHKLAVMFIDLDHFKEVNDTLGHSAGDLLLKQVAERLKCCLPEGDTLARLGGDEFTLLLTDASCVEGVIDMANQILRQLSRPFIINGHEVSVTASIGGALYPDDGLDSEALLKHADVAMYRSKELGRNSFQLFKAAMNARSLERFTMSSRFKQALEQDEFELYYQPIYCVQSGDVVALEALLRWHDPQLGMISPAQFIPLAEELGMILKLDEWVIGRACSQIAQWRAEGVEVHRMAVNISAHHFTHGSLVDTIAGSLARHQLAGNALEIEITESSFISSLNDARNILNALKKLGVSIALDDFGTGYSALSYLTKLPIDSLKIDASFIAKVPDEYGNSEIVRAIIALAKSLNLKVIAEGVEKRQQHDYLMQQGCHYVQGFLHCKPVNGTQWLETNRPAQAVHHSALTS